MTIICPPGCHQTYITGFMEIILFIHTRIFSQVILWLFQNMSNHLQNIYLDRFSLLQQFWQVKWQPDPHSWTSEIYHSIRVAFWQIIPQDHLQLPNGHPPEELTNWYLTIWSDNNSNIVNYRLIKGIQQDLLARYLRTRIESWMLLINHGSIW